MITLRCTRKLLDRLHVPGDTESDAAPTAALGDWYANLVRVGHDQLVVAMSERSFLVVVLPAKRLSDELPRNFVRTVRELLASLGVPNEMIEAEVAAMQPIAYARTGSRSLVAALNGRVQMVELLWGDGLDATAIMEHLAGMMAPASSDYERPSRLTRRLLGLEAHRPPPATVARLRVALEGLSPPIWRRFIVPADITLPRLHVALQLVMGWKNRHLHAFEVGDIAYGPPNEDFPEASPRDERNVRLADIAKQGETFRYRYDFGDDWSHEVLVESIGPNEGQVRGAVCLEGANHCPPEDVGGPPGWMDLLQALRDPAHEDHAHMVEWLGDARFDPAAFDVEIVNAGLRVLLGE